MTMPLNSFDTLQVLESIAARVSHSIRTPLSVTVGAIEDLKHGIELNEQDVLDACAAVKRIRTALDSMKVFLGPSEIARERGDLHAFFAVESKAGFGLSGVGGTFVPNTLNPSLVEFDRTLFRRAIQSLLRYSLLKHPATASSMPLTFELLENGDCAIRDESSLYHYQLITPLEDTDFVQRMNGSASVREVTEVDNSLDVFELLFAEQVFVLHRGSLSLEITSDFHMCYTFSCSSCSPLNGS